MEKKRFKYIHIKHVNDEMFEGHPVYRVFNNKTGEQLAILSYYKKWKEYIFSTREEFVFNNTCLKDITGFMDELNETLSN